MTRILILLATSTILANCAVPRHNTDWGAVSHEVGRNLKDR
jgi:hypothetical protein